jgi:hypothetical protein
VARSLLATSALVLGVGAFLHARGSIASVPEVVTWLGSAWPIAATLLAVVLRGEGLVAPPPGPAPSLDAARQVRTALVFFAILEAGVLGAALALIVGPSWLPLATALLPLAAMALNLPSREP